DVPLISKDVLHAPDALAVRLILWRCDRGRAGVDGPLVGRVDVRQVEIEPRRRRLIRPVGFAHLDDRIADPDPRVVNGPVTLPSGAAYFASSSPPTARRMNAISGSARWGCR